ncbi:unnamed protein product [Moneuplotes crassus]|uniref:Uncharacterized protein n=1 Tax=Euplotes crassus TaxID=5936 RepID=A0AAD2D5I9_EUPCR|nr:unnamed protein product [Moneuplotes crassus]
MKFLLIIAFALAIVSASSGVADFMKNVSLKVDSCDTTIFEGTTLSPTGVDATFVMRLDIGKDIFSYTLGYVDTAFGKFTNLTYAWDFNTEKSYIHTTGDDFCMDDEFESPKTSEFNSFFKWLIDYLDNNAISEHQIIDGVEHLVVHFSYNIENAATVIYNEKGDNFQQMAGMFQGTPFSIDFTSASDNRCTPTEEHIPKSCTV